MNYSRPSYIISSTALPHRPCLFCSSHYFCSSPIIPLRYPVHGILRAVGIYQDSIALVGPAHLLLEVENNLTYGQGQIQSPIKNGKESKLYQPDDYAWYLQCRNIEPAQKQNKKLKRALSRQSFSFMLLKFSSIYVISHIYQVRFFESVVESAFLFGLDRKGFYEKPNQAQVSHSGRNILPYRFLLLVQDV